MMNDENDKNDQNDQNDQNDENDNDENNARSIGLHYICGCKNGGKNNLEWHNSKTYLELSVGKIGKTRVISAVILGLHYNGGQRLRYCFLKYPGELPILICIQTLRAFSTTMCKKIMHYFHIGTHCY
jgi:hypothetical protein